MGACASGASETHPGTKVSEREVSDIVSSRVFQPFMMLRMSVTVTIGKRSNLEGILLVIKYLVLRNRERKSGK